MGVFCFVFLGELVFKMHETVDKMTFAISSWIHFVVSISYFPFYLLLRYLDIRSIFIVLLVALFALKFTNLVVVALYRYIFNYFCYSLYLLFSLSKWCEILMLFCQLNPHNFRGCYVIRAVAVHVNCGRRTFEGLTWVKNWNRSSHSSPPSQARQCSFGLLYRTSSSTSFK